MKKFKILLSQSDSNNNHYHEVGVSLPEVKVNLIEGPLVDGLEMIKRQV